MATTPAAVSSRLLTPSNALTASRLVLVPVLIALLLAGGEPGTGRRWLALGVFLAAAATDRLDGVLARRRGEVTRFGVVADPIADKALMLGAFSAVAWLGDLSWWVVGVVAAREILVTGLRLIVLRHGRLMPAIASGKAKTALQIVTAAVLLLPPASVRGSAEAITVLVLVMVAVTLISGAEIFVRLARPAAGRA